MNASSLSSRVIEKGRSRLTRVALESVVAGVALAVGISGHGGHTLAVGTARAVVEARVALLAQTAYEARRTDAAESAGDAR